MRHQTVLLSVRWLRFTTMPRRAACLILCSAAACSDRQDSRLPAAVASSLGEFTTLCREAGGEPYSDDAVRRADLDADGYADFVLFAGWLECENAWSVFGDREKTILVFAGDGSDGASEAFRDAAFDAKLEAQGDGTQLWLTTSAEQCGRPRAPTFAEESFCERAVVSAAATRFEYAPLSTVRMIE